MSRSILAGLLVLAGLLACYKSAALASEANGLAGLWSARYEQPQALPAIWREALPDENVRVVFYREETREIAAPLFDRTKRLVFIEVAGDASLLFLPGRLAAGGWPDDKRGCLIDEESALELWGTDNPTGLNVTVDGIEYEVTGVVKAARPLLLVTAGEDAGLSYTGVYFRGGKDDAFPRQAFIQTLAGFSGALPLIEETGLLAARLRFLSRLPIWALCIVAAWRRLLPGLFKSRAARILALFVWAALSFYAFDMPNIVTPDMLPTRFADFSFWPARFKALFESFCAAWFMRGSFSALLWTVELIFPVTGFSVLAAAVFGAAGYFHCNASNVSEKNFK